MALASIFTAMCGGFRMPRAEAGTDFRSVIVLGSPDDDVSSHADAGSVVLVPRGLNGELLPNESLRLLESNVGGSVSAGHRFGAATALGDLNGDGAADLAIGAPGADQGRGRVYVVPFDPVTQSFAYGRTRVVRQGVNGIEGSAERGDAFGAALLVGSTASASRWLAVGVPGEDVGTTVDAGMVAVIPRGSSGTGDVEIWQGNGVPGAAEAGDRFGYSLAGYFHTTNNGLAIGAPFEDVGSSQDAGAVTLARSTAPEGLPGSAGGTILLDGHGGGPGAVEAGDQFGRTLATVYSFGGVGQLAIGAPFEDVGLATDAGVVSIYGGFADRILVQFRQGGAGLAERPESGDRFGAAMAANGLRLVIGAPGEDRAGVVDAGVVHALYAEGGSLFSGSNDDLFSQETAGIPNRDHAGDRFGAGFAVIDNQLPIVTPGESRTARRAGAVTVLNFESGSGRWLTAGASFVDEDTPGVPGVAGSNDHFGWSVGTATS